MVLSRPVLIGRTIAVGLALALFGCSSDGPTSPHGGEDNTAPVAQFDYSCAGLSCSFDATRSSDRDGDRLSFEWDFGDGASATGSTTQHTYGHGGTVTVTLTVRDASEAATASANVSLAENRPPQASFTTTCSDLTCSFDATGSSDPDGDPLSFEWDFGDGASATGETAEHTYASSGTVTVTLTVRDTSLAATATEDLTVAVNGAPEASFTASCDGLTCSFDGTASSDPEGDPLSFEWDFGDGASATGSTASHSYDSSGTRTVVLTVSDGTHTATRSSSLTATDLATDVIVEVDATTTHQRIEGFGATTHPLVYQNGNVDYIPSSLRSEAIAAVYGQVGLNMGNIVSGSLEKNNDNDDPFSFAWDNFTFWRAAVAKEKVVDPGAAYGFDNPYPALVIGVKWASPWLGDIRAVDYDRYLDETAEYVLAGVLDWQDRYGSLPRYAQILNESLSGNRALDGGTVTEVVDIVRRAGERLEQEGLGAVKLVVPAEETEELSLTVARAILEDATARQFVGAIAYHPYPYSSPYANVPNILATSGSGSPVAAKIAVREDLAALGETYGLPVWMTEVSNAGVGPRTMDHLRGRAIHIHDELTYADASAYYGMLAIWDSDSHFDHFGNRRLEDAMDSIVLVDNDAGEILITGMGYAIGHYARWLERGALRVSASSTDPRVLVSAFRDDDQGRFTTVLINNKAQEVRVEVQIDGLDPVGQIEGEVSAGADRWEPLTPFTPQGEGTVQITLPAKSVTTLAGSF